MKYLPLILVAEDVPLNMTLMVALLNQLIPESEVVQVPNGKQAVHVTERIKVDMIFMDIQMPEMDGLEATRVIRQMEVVNQVDKPVPIIAVTAFTLNKEKERCLEAGMNDFLTKPLEKDSIYRILFKYLHGAMNVAHEAPSESFSQKRNDHFDIKALVERTSIEEAILLGLAQQAASNLGDHMKTLSDAISNNNPQHIKNAAHTIKGIALNLDFPNLAYLSKQMEVLADEEPDKIRKHFQDMSEEVTVLKDFF
jgi:CheY-like chemotaxis protein/HPt (histidine-containing phosphotransfer) domain-containing protein